MSGDHKFLEDHFSSASRHGLFEDSTVIPEHVTTDAEQPLLNNDPICFQFCMQEMHYLRRTGLEVFLLNLSDGFRIPGPFVFRYRLLMSHPYLDAPNCARRFWLTCNREVRRDIEGFGPVQEAGRSTVMLHQCPPTDGVFLCRQRLWIEM